MNEIQCVARVFWEGVRELGTKPFCELDKISKDKIEQAAIAAIDEMRVRYKLLREQLDSVIHDRDKWQNLARDLYMTHQKERS